MISIYKKRSFSDFFSDTIAFFKENGKHYFRHYFIINGAFLMVLAVIIYFITNIYFNAFSTGIRNRQNMNFMSDFFNENAVLFFSTFIVLFLLLILISLLNIAFPVVYLDLYDENQGAHFSTKQLVSSLKSHIGRLLKFSIGTIVIIAPICLIVMSICILLCFIIIGFPLLMIVFPAIFSLIILTFYEYINNKSRFFASLSVGFTMLKNQFWSIVGATFLMYFIMSIFQNIVAFVPYIIGLVLFFTMVQDGSSADPESSVVFVGILIALVLVLTVILGYLLNGILIVSQGMIYYSARENNENNEALQNIDLIGKNAE